ncbi:unnamed protein product [Gongylonema pulchrum]|uniref:Uncharacterized protein n=1 Tax=Gongylonema pulchrum TaxID=637853 RepID=A0A183CZP0_9BILA|nr:unnamed protein product [Gongylonema pulchrum]
MQRSGEVVLCAKSSSVLTSKQFICQSVKSATDCWQLQTGITVLLSRLWMPLSLLRRLVRGPLAALY